MRLEAENIMKFLLKIELLPKTFVLTSDLGLTSSSKKQFVLEDTNKMFQCLGLNESALWSIFQRQFFLSVRRSLK